MPSIDHQQKLFEEMSHKYFSVSSKPKRKTMYENRKEGGLKVTDRIMGKECSLYTLSNDSLTFKQEQNACMDIEQQQSSLNDKM